MNTKQRDLPIVLFIAVSMFILTPCYLRAEVSGDVNRDGKRGLEDALIILQELSGFERSLDHDSDGYDARTDCNDDDPITYPGAIETCDGADNNCNGVVDEGALWANKGQPCIAGTGACQASGIYVCDAGDPAGPTICSAVPNTGSAEVCDGLDNNCDGQIDEGALWADGQRVEVSADEQGLVIDGKPVEAEEAA